MRLLFWTVLLFALWLVLTANLQVANLIIGGGISFGIALIYSKLFIHADFEIINPYWFFVYLLVLLKNLIISNLQIAKRVLSPDMRLSPAIVAVKTELTSDWKKLLLANSVTLTPGTLTLDIQKDILYIHVIECKNISNKEEIIKEFEQIIAKI
jgi:multicomponent Na+:H+ antiporter subunit E